MPRSLQFLPFVLALQISVALAGEAPLKPEINPPGDIPDSQVFVVHTSSDGYSLKVPEGWAMEAKGASTVFKDKYNTITTMMVEDPSASAALIKAGLVPKIEAEGRAAKLGKVRVIKVKGKEAVLAEYTANSEPNAVTGKQIRLEGERVFYPAGDHVLLLDLTAPQGADNVDQWKLITNSVRLK